MLNMQERLPVMEQFYSIQGEGFHQGRAAYFIRLGGCDVGCVWCDVKESWDAGKHTLRSTDEILEEIKKYPVSIVIITGGEPLLYDLRQLTSRLQEANYKTHLETSGAYALTGSWDWICFSPKKFKQPLPSVAAKAHELKVVVFNKSDLAWAEENRKNVSADCKLFLQPEWSKKEEMTPLIIAFVKENPAWEISLQLHKYLQVP